jgi:hypothetical protein
LNPSVVNRYGENKSSQTLFNGGWMFTQVFLASPGGFFVR